MQSFESRLSRAMELRAYNQTDLARHAKTTQSTVYRWLTGTQPRARALEDLCNALRVRKAWLLRGEEPMEPELCEPELVENAMHDESMVMREDEVAYKVPQRPMPDEPKGVKHVTDAMTVDELLRVLERMPSAPDAGTHTHTETMRYLMAVLRQRVRPSLPSDQG